MQEILTRIRQVLEYKEPNYNELLEELKLLFELDLQSYEKTIKDLDLNTLANIATIMPDFMLQNLLELFDINTLAKAAEELESDDATDLIQAFELLDKQRAFAILNKINKSIKEQIMRLKGYDESEVGAWMQTELFKAKLDDEVAIAISKYRLFKERTELNNILQVFIVDDNGCFVNSIELSELLLHDFDSKLSELIVDKDRQAVLDSAQIDSAILLVEDYDLSVLAVVDEANKLVGRLTYDDIHDIIEERATEQLYNLAGVDDEAEDESTLTATKARSLWLMINLITSLISAHIISLFSGEIEKLVALAALMPIVASMGGNTGSQALTVTVRRLSLNEIDFNDAKKVIARELRISFDKWQYFCCDYRLYSLTWFSMPMLGVVIALSMLINLSLAGFIGSFVPLALKRLGVDPAVGSSVLLTASTDALGFFCFLLLAKLILLS